MTPPRFPAVLDVELLNPYQGIDASQNERHNIRNVTGQPLRRGILVDAIYDIGRIENVHFNPWWSGRSKVYQWQMENGEAFVFGRAAARGSSGHLPYQRGPGEEGGKMFTVRAESVSAQNKYIQSATLNGKLWNRAWFRQEDIAAGGTLVLVVGPRPNTSWGSAPADAPPSMTH